MLTSRRSTVYRIKNHHKIRKSIWITFSTQRNRSILSLKVNKTVCATIDLANISHLTLRLKVPVVNGRSIARKCVKNPRESSKKKKKPKKKGEKASKLLLCRRVPKWNEKMARYCSTKRHDRSIVNWIFDRLEDTRVARQGTSKQRLNNHGVASVLKGSSFGDAQKLSDLTRLC